MENWQFFELTRNTRNRTCVLSKRTWWKRYERLKDRSRSTRWTLHRLVRKWLASIKPRTGLTKFEGDSIQHSIFENRKQHVASASVLLRNVCITSWTTTTSSLSSSSSIWISSSSSSLYLVEKEPSENGKIQYHHYHHHISSYIITLSFNAITESGIKLM